MNWMVSKGCTLPVVEARNFSINVDWHFDEDEERNVNATLLGSYEHEAPKKSTSEGECSLLAILFMQYSHKLQVQY